MNTTAISPTAQAPNHGSNLHPILSFTPTSDPPDILGSSPSVTLESSLSHSHVLHGLLKQLLTAHLFLSWPLRSFLQEVGTRGALCDPQANTQSYSCLQGLCCPSPLPSFSRVSHHPPPPSLTKCITSGSHTGSSFCLQQLSPLQPALSACPISALHLNTPSLYTCPPTPSLDQCPYHSGMDTSCIICPFPTSGRLPIHSVSMDRIVLIAHSPAPSQK